MYIIIGASSFIGVYTARYFIDKGEDLMYMYWTMILKQLALHMQTNIYP